jgi:hypothetical protein
MGRKLSVLQWVPMTLSLAAIALAIAKELGKPARQRTWHGRMLGFIPYELRPPTLERIKASLWNPNDSNLMTGQPFGVGWSINFYPLVEQLRRSVASSR